MVQYFPVITGSLTVNGDIIVSGTSSISASNAISSSLALDSQLLSGTGSVGFTTTGSFTATSSSLSSRTTQIESVYATTGSNSFRATQSITGSLTVTGQIVAQTLNVQQVTSSIVYSSGSNTFGCDLNSRQTFTGSVLMTGSLIVNTTGPELQVNNNGVILGNLLTDNHSITGSLRVTGSNVIITGTLSGTSATFSGNAGLTNGELTVKTSAFGGVINLESGTNTNKWLLYHYSPDNTFRMNYNGSGNDEFILSTAGAATFSSNVGIKNSGRNESLAVEHSTGNVSAGFFYNTGIATGQSYGLTVYAGTNASDRSFLVANQGGANPYLYVRGDGNVGIGTSSPTSLLHLQSATASGTQYLMTSAGGGTALTYRQVANETTQQLNMVVESNHPMVLWTNSVERMRITSAGVVSINNSGGEANAGLDRFTMGYFVSNYGWMQTWASTPLYLNRLGNNVSAFGSAGFGLVTTTSSDVRIKKNIVSIESALDKVNALRGVYFEFDKNNELKVSVPHGKTRVGLIAQEVETTIPEAVIDGDNEGTPKSVDYTGLVGVLVKAIQELTQKVNALENK